MQHAAVTVATPSARNICGPRDDELGFGGRALKGFLNLGLLISRKLKLEIETLSKEDHAFPEFSRLWFGKGRVSSLVRTDTAMSTSLVLLCGVLVAGTGIGTQAAWTSSGIGRTPRQIMALSAGAKVSRPLHAGGPFGAPIARRI